MIVVIVLLSSVNILLILIMGLSWSNHTTWLIGNLSWDALNESLLAQLRINRILYLRILLTIIYGGILLYRRQERVHGHWFNVVLSTSRSIPSISATHTGAPEDTSIWGSSYKGLSIILIGGLGEKVRECCSCQVCRSALTRQAESLLSNWWIMLPIIFLFK